MHMIQAELTAPLSREGAGDTVTHGPDRNLRDDGSAGAALRWVRRLADGDRLAALNDQALVADLRALEEVGRLVDAGRMFAAGLIAQRSDTSRGSQRLCAREGFTRPEDMISQVTGASARVVRERIRQAEPLQPRSGGTDGWATAPDREPGGDTAGETDARGTADPGGSVPFPLLRRAVRAGLLSPETAGVITQALRPALDRGTPLVRVAEGERALLVAALGRDTVTDQARWEVFGTSDSEGVRTLLDEARRSGTQVRAASLGQLARLARSWQRLLIQEADHAAGQTGIERARAGRRRVEARRFLTVLPLQEGTRRVEGELLPEIASQLERLLDAYLNPRTDETAHGASAPAGMAPEGTPDSRSPGQKRHDAFAGVLTLAAGVPEMPLMGGAAPTLVVTVAADQLGDPCGVAFLQGSHSEPDSPTDIHTAHHTGCAGAIQRILTNDEGRILGVSAPQRVFTAHQRRAIATRDGGCIIPGCTVPATWCEVHHVTEWARGGPTHTDNGVTLCWHHHRCLDTLDWQIRMDNGIPCVRPPASIDPDRRWVPAQTSLHRTFIQLAHQRGSPPPASGGTGPPHPPGIPGHRGLPGSVPPDQDPLVASTE
ncbi:MAG: HNH endonuclease [Actinomyces sp.]|nr:HNH endonuclease signature motif containing protein [Actinomyces sp.]MCI1788124.1 HNH endonuclease [Actinomyces sp.]MCI1830271.1 HNH endonuclease [Actinomyces sp.]MCI1867059.1 HNH endonuclease [Actinomyces sp.]